MGLGKHIIEHEALGLEQSIVNVSGGLVPKGAYSNVTTYAIGDSVDYEGSSYIAIAESTGNLPTDTSKWQVLANKGADGYVGADGAQGPQGIQGIQGEQGIQGIQGPAGADSTVPGPQGDVGPQGPQGEQGDPFIYTDFTPEQLLALTGPEGPQGETGAQGIQGIQGATGSQGIQGVKGDTGDTGPQGPTGATGADSTVPGPQGIQGETGPQGIQGETGATGSAGPNQVTTTTDSDITGILKGTGTKVAQAISGTDYVAPIAGKGLSTEDYSTAEKTKLSGIATGAEVNVNADWNSSAGDSQILNKPTIPVNIDDLGDVTLATPLVDQVLKYNGSAWINGNETTVNGGAGVELYYVEAASDITGYSQLLKTPDTGGELDETVIANNNEVLVNEYITPVLGGTKIDSGTWSFDIWAYVDVSISGSSSIKIDMIKRTSGGTETTLFSVNTGSLMTDLGTEPDVVTSVQPEFSIDPTDRLVAKVYGKNTSMVNRTIHFFHGGTTHYSHINSPLVVRHNDLAGLQGGTSGEYNHLTNAQLAVVGNTSGTNSGDNATNSQYSGLAASKEDTGVAAGLITTHASLSTGVHGAGVNSLVYSNDAKLTDARTPLTHDNTKHSATYITSADAVAPNTAITGATKTKITYDAKGLVTAGSDATTADIADSTDKRYCTDAQKVVISNTSGTNTGDKTLADLGGVPTTRTVNSKALSANITLTPDDLDDTSTTHKFVAAADVTKLSNLSGTNTGDQVVPANETGAANNFLSAYNSTTGAWTKARPTWANVDKTTSSIADIATRSHTALTDIGTNAHSVIDTHLAATAAHGATGAVVGTTNTQTLSGKTLTSPKADHIEEETAAHGVVIDSCGIKDGLVVGGAGTGVANTSLSTTAGDLGGAWNAFTPTWTNLVVGTGGAAANTGYYTQIGKTVHFIITTVLGTSGASVGASGVVFSLPVTASSHYIASKTPMGNMRIDDSGNIGGIGYIDFPSTTTGRVIIQVASTTYTSVNVISTTLPMTWGAGDAIYITGTYEAA